MWKIYSAYYNYFRYFPLFSVYYILQFFIFVQLLTRKWCRKAMKKSQIAATQVLIKNFIVPPLSEVVWKIFHLLSRCYCTSHYRGDNFQLLVIRKWSIFFTFLKNVLSDGKFFSLFYLFRWQLDAYNVDRYEVF
jgi:hypothetical protein